MRTSLLALLLLAVPAALAQTAPATLAFQGALSDPGGTPVADGTYAVVIRLHDALTGGTLEYSETHSVTTADGAFSLLIGGGTPAAGNDIAAVTFDQALWVEVAVGGTTLTPRTALQAAPYARSLTSASRIRGDVPGIAARPFGNAVVSVENTSTTANATAMHLKSGTVGLISNGTGLGVFGSGAIGVHGQSPGTSSAHRGVFGDGGVSGAGVYGLSQNSIGVLGISANGTGVYAQSAGGGTGVYASSNSGTAVEGTSSSGTGVTGSTGGATAAGVSGFNYAGGSNDGYGVFGSTSSTNGSGVYGESTASGTTYGVQGRITSSLGAGVYGSTSGATSSGVSGINTAGGSNDGYGVYGRTASTNGSGVYGESTSSGTTYGVHGRITSSFGAGVLGRSTGTGSAAAVYGFASGSTGDGRGVQGQSNSTSGIGVRGLAAASTGVTYGVRGEASSSSGTGVYGTSTSATGITYAVRGLSTSPNGWAGHFTGGNGVFSGTTTRRAGRFESTGGTGFGTSTLWVRNTSTADGIAAWFSTEGTDATVVAAQGGTGDVLRGFGPSGLVFRVRGNGNVSADGTFTGGGADLAEFFPLADGATVEPGQVVGLTAGRVSLATDGAEQVAVISSNPAFVGNPDAADGGALVALVGQVAVDVSGDAAPGDLLVASGAADGRARAISPSAYTPADGAVLGRVLTSDADGVVALVGVDQAAALRGVVARQAEHIDALQADRDRHQTEAERQSRDIQSLRADHADQIRALRAEVQAIRDALAPRAER